MPVSKKRFALILFSITGLALVYMFQRFDYFAIVSDSSNANPNIVFAFNRVSRFILNDLFAILLIYAMFNKRTYTHIAILIQIMGTLILMPTYLYFKLTFEGPSEISSPFLSFLHRITVHPFLILLLIPGFYLLNKQEDAS